MANSEERELMEIVREIRALDERSYRLRVDLGYCLLRLHKLGYSEDRLAELVGKSQSWVSRQINWLLSA